ncbi:MAG TPA: 50S ribosomal protein L17 [Candidatus Paceibacterota bacterium]|nr:50S ribosomal protein L17 [Candidatus Paceibacterota bacterium]
MRHAKKGKKFNRKRGPRASFLRNLSNDLIRTGAIETTEARAKAIRPIVERLVTFAKKQTLASRRVILSRVHNEKVANKLYVDYGPRYAERAGGYLRITKLGTSRKRDGAAMARIEFV